MTNSRASVLAFSLFLSNILSTLAPLQADQMFPGKSSQWHGFTRFDFEHDSRECIVVTPKQIATGKPWIWRARFFGHEPQADIALLTKGYHLVYCDVSDMFGNPQAVKHWDSFYQYLTTQHNFAAKVALEGMSRGGLIIYNWAIKNPGKVACIYGDAPVCAIRSWPGGKGVGKGSKQAWRAALRAYGLTEEEIPNFQGNPIDNLKPLADAGVPLLNIVGDADEVVPVAENTAVLEKRYRQLGGSIKVIHKPGVGHHPHSLPDPGPIVEFVVAHVTQANSLASRNVHLRGPLTNSRIRFEREKKGHVAFMGGSITEMNGYRPMVSRLLKQRFPNTEFTFTNAGIASTCSTTGAFRLQSDLLSKGPVDLLLIEFAVNDDQDAGHSRIECIRGLEGIFRQARRYNPNMDIVLIYFVNPTILESLKAGQAPQTIASHDEVARYYNISTVHLAQEIADRITQKTLTWKQFGGTHPGRFGNEIATSLVNQLFSKAWTNPLAENASQVPHPFPAVPIDSFHYGLGHFLNPSKASFSAAWQFHKPDWKNIPGAKRDRFVNIPMLCTQEPGSELALSFTGTAVGAYIVAGPDAGIAEASIDGSPWESTNLFHRHSRGLHYPRTVMFATELKNREHTLKLRMKQDTTSAGHAMRIMWFVVNGK